MLPFIFIFVILSECNARDALKYFIEHKQIENFQFTIFSSFNKTDVVWVEYKYIYTNKKIRNDLMVRDKVLNIGIIENQNNQFDCKFLNNALSGYSIKIVNLLEEHLGFRSNYFKLNDSISNESTSSTEMLTNNLDLTICHPEIDYKNNFEIRLLYTTLKSIYVLIYKRANLNIATKDIFILTFAGTLWLCFLVLLIVLAIFLHISTKQYSVIYPNYDLWNWVDITLWANAAACQQGLSSTPKGFASRLLFFLGYLAAYLLYTGFTASITSLLLQETMDNGLTISDLEKLKVQTIMVAGMALTKNASELINNSLIVATTDDLFEFMEYDGIVGIVPKIFMDEYFANKSNYEQFHSYSISVLPFEYYNRGFIINKDNPYRQELNNGLLTLRASGLLKNALDQSLLPKATETMTSNYSSADLQHVGSAIVILLVGTLSSAIFLLIELIVALYGSCCTSTNPSNFFYS